MVDLGNLLNVSKVSVFFSFLRLLENQNCIYTSVCFAQYTTEIQQKFDNTHINMTTINLLSPEITSQLRSLSKKTVNTTTLTQQVNNLWFDVNLVRASECNWDPILFILL